jgi:hypothetical protein
MLTFVAVLLGIALVSAALAPRDGGVDEPSSVGPAPTATRAPEEPQLESRSGSAGVVPTVDDIPGEPPQHQLDAQSEGQVVEVEAGRRVRLAVASDELTSVQIGEDGPVEAVDPDAPARFDLSYERPLTLPIRELASGRTIGELRVVEAEPAA